jgi:hypothetical protein
MKLSEIIAHYRNRELNRRLAQWVAQTRASEEITRFRRNRAAQLPEPRKTRFLESTGGVEHV